MHAHNNVRRQQRTLALGLTLENLWRFSHKFSLPLLTGIMTALVMANVDMTHYDYWSQFFLCARGQGRLSKLPLTCTGLVPMNQFYIRRSSGWRASLPTS
jgi:uncharacterized membrane protein YedE/YeeE